MVLFIIGCLKCSASAFLRSCAPLPGSSELSTPIVAAFSAWSHYEHDGMLITPAETRYSPERDGSRWDVILAVPQGFVAWLLELSIGDLYTIGNSKLTTGVPHERFLIAT